MKQENMEFKHGLDWEKTKHIYLDYHNKPKKLLILVIIRYHSLTIRHLFLRPTV